MRRLTFLFFLLTLAAAPPPPQFNGVPASVLDSMCTRLRDEGFGAGLDVVRTTRPLVTRQSLQALAEMAFKQRLDTTMVEAALASNASPLPVARTTACDWNPVDAALPRSPDMMTLELSAPFAVPFRRGGFGVLARMSLAGESATWYWIPLRNEKGMWLAERSIALALHE